MNCQHCQSLLLDHLYGLLDAQEAAALDAHLASCPACAAASAETARVQGLIARAAKSAFPATKFEPPVTQPSKSAAQVPNPGAAAVLPFPASGDRQTRGFSHRVGTIIPWAVAAAVLIAIPSTVFPVLGMLRTADLANRDADVAQLNAATTNETKVAQVDSTKRLSDAEFRYEIALQAEKLLANKWKDEQQAFLKTADARRFVVDVQKPATIQPGAPNDFIVVVRDDREWERVGKLTVAEIHAVDVSDAVIFTQPLNNEKAATNQHPIRLPASAWAKVKPNSELFLVVAEVDEKTQTRTEQDRIRLAGPVYTTLLITDKAVYRPGERLFFRSLTLDRIAFKPPPREQILKYELLQSDGRTAVNVAAITGTTDLVRVSAEGQVTPMRTSDGDPVRGVGCGEFVLPADLPDGDYVLRLTEGQHPGGYAATLPLPVTRIVKVQSGTTDNYRKEIGFTRESFVPGDTVEAWADVKLQDRQQPNVTVARAVADADGVTLTGIEFDKATDAKGRAKVRFTLPPELLDADVRLKVTFRTPHGDEFIATRVPVIGNKVKVEFFPECGDNLIAGVPCKVYVRATTPAGQPVNFRGTITDGRQTLAKVESFNDPDQPATNRGLASFTYTPQLGTKVWLKLESPSAVYAPVLAGVPVHGASVALLGGPGATAMRTGFMLPPVKTDGVTMTVLNPVTAPGEPIRLEVYSVGQPRRLVIGAYTRGKLSDMQKVLVEKTGEAHPVTLMAGNDPRGGVVRITVFEEGDENLDLKPVAERLVFRKPGEVLNLAWSVSPPVATRVAIAPLATPTAPPLVPANSPLNCVITATDEKGGPAAAVLYASVVNSGVAPGKKDRSVRTHFLLAGEVKNPDDLEYADFLLTNHPKAAEALDLLLGTQGWRRFVEQSSLPAAPVVPVAQGGVNPVGKPPAVAPVPPEVAKLMIQNGQYPTWAEPAQLREQRELYRKYVSRYETTTKAVTQAKAALDTAREESRNANTPAPATTTAETARRDIDEKAAKAEAARETVRKFRANVWYGVAGLVVLALGCGVVTVLRPAGRFPMGFSTLGSLALAAFLVFAGWDNSMRVSASDGRAMAPSAKENAKPMRHWAKTDDFTSDRAPESSATVAMEPPAPPSGPNMSSAKAKDNTAPDKITPTGDVTGNTIERSPPHMGFKSDIPKSPVAKDSRPAFQPYSPPGIYPFVRPTDGKGGVKPAPADPAPSPVPMPSPLPIKPAAPVADPKMGLTTPGGGWEPNRPNGVTSTELATGQRSMFLAQRKRNAPLDVTNKLDSLKRDTDRAAKWHASERETAIPSPPDTSFHFGLNAKAKLPPPDAVWPLTSVEAYSAQARGAASPPPPPLVVREFAAPRPSPVQLADAPDPPDTVLWQPIIVLPADGKAVLPFHIGSAPGGYEVVIAGHTLDGRLGSTRGMILVSPLKTLSPNGPGTQGVPGGAILPPNPTAPPPQPMP